MRDFDQERKEREEATVDDRSFVLGGHSFRAKASVRPEVMFEFENIGGDTPPSSVLAIADQLILDMLEDGDGEAGQKYRDLRATGDDIDMSTLLELCEWLIGLVTGRPTEPSGGSSPLPGPTPAGTPLTDDSSSEDSTQG